MVPKACARFRDPANAGNDDDLYVEAIVAVGCWLISYGLRSSLPRGTDGSSDRSPARNADRYAQRRVSELRAQAVRFGSTARGAQGRGRKLRRIGQTRRA